MEFIINEIQGKRIHDQFQYYYSSSTNNNNMNQQPPQVWVSGPLIIGAGPSGLATAACLKKKGIPSLILERSDCIASLWKHKTYDRLHLHLPKQYCELPFLHFPKNLPTYPTKNHFITYMEEYASCFCLEPVFGETVLLAEFDGLVGFWRVKTSGNREYLSRWLIVATGENAEELVPEIDGMDEFLGTVVHTSCYKTGECFRGKKVLVVGCGNSGMEVCLDLCEHRARPSLVVRDSVHILPQQMLGISTFGLSMCLLKWLPMKIVDKFLLIMSRIILGDTARLGLKRPTSGPLELKSVSGKTPVLDFGTFAKIRDGDIQVRPEIKKLRSYSVEFVDGVEEDFDAVILATGYKSNTPTWLKAEPSLFSKKNGRPEKPFPGGWKGENGLYTVGFTKRGLLGTSMEARMIAEDLQHQWNSSQNSSFTSVPYNKNEIIEKITRNNRGKEPTKH